MDILDSLGINGKILGAQVVNFFLLLWVLKRFLYKPLLDILEKREKKIKKGLVQTKKAEERLKEIDAKEEKRLEKAQEKANKILEEAHNQTEESKEDLMKRAKEEIDKWKDEAREQIKKEKEEVKSEVRAETANLIIRVVKKIVPRNMTKKDEEEWLEEIERSVKKSK